MRPILISNSFPFSLVRRPVQVEPRSLRDLLAAIHERPWFSAWGHSNTLTQASAIAGIDLTPKTSRPALVLNNTNLPSLDGQSFDEVWLLSPEYTPGFRPGVGQELAADAICRWLVLQLIWTPSDPAQP